MVSSHAFNVSMFIRCVYKPVAVPFFISRSAACTSHDGSSFVSVWIMVLCAHVFACADVLGLWLRLGLERCRNILLFCSVIASPMLWEKQHEKIVLTSVCG